MSASSNIYVYIILTGRMRGADFDAALCSHYVTDEIGDGSTLATQVDQISAGSKWQFKTVSPEWIDHCIRWSLCCPAGAVACLAAICLVLTWWCFRNNGLVSWCAGLDSQRHIFSAVVACLSGFRGQDRSRILELIVRGGGAVTTRLTSNCTHLIASELRGDKCRQAMDMSDIKIVSARWVSLSIDNGRMEEEQNYCARAPLANLSLTQLDPCLQYHGTKVCTNLFLFPDFFLDVRRRHKNPRCRAPRTGRAAVEAHGGEAPKLLRHPGSSNRRREKLRSPIQRSLSRSSSTAYSCNDIFQNNLQSSKPKLVGPFKLKRGQRYLRALASSFVNSFGKCHWRWDRLYIMYGCLCIIYREVSMLPRFPKFLRLDLPERRAALSAHFASPPRVRRRCFGRVLGCFARREQCTPQKREAHVLRQN